MEPEIKSASVEREWSNFFSGVVETTQGRISRALRRRSLARGSPPFRGDGRRTRIALTPTGKTR
jgi:hypothetical protein